jgi:hypothetical protein
MGEMLLVHHKDNIPLIIIRPTMVTSTRNDPFPGWIEGLRYTLYSHHLEIKNEVLYTNNLVCVNIYIFNQIIL